MAPQREWFETDYYKVLGVSAEATDKEITRAYRKLAKQYHPDSNPGSEDRFKEISAAYDVLGDADKRKEYDEVRRLGVELERNPSGEETERDDVDVDGDDAGIGPPSSDPPRSRNCACRRLSATSPGALG